MVLQGQVCRDGRDEGRDNLGITGMDTLDTVKDLVNTNHGTGAVIRSPQLGTQALASGDNQGDKQTPGVMLGKTKKVMLAGFRKERTCSYLPGGICTVHGGVGLPEN